MDATGEGMTKIMIARPRINARSIPQKEGNTPSPITQKVMISINNSVKTYRSAKYVFIFNSLSMTLLL